MMRKPTNPAFIFIFVFVSAVPLHVCAAAERLSATMGEVLLRNLQPGATYHLTSLLRFPLRVTYEGAKPVLLTIDPSLPEANEGKEGYEPVPSLNWVGLEPSRFDLNGSSTVESNVSLAIPDDPAILGKKYIVYLYSQILGKGKGVSLGVGTKGRLLISIASEKKSSSDTVPASSYMDFKIKPASIQMKNVRPGKKMKLNKALKRDFFVLNTGAKKMEFSLEIVTGASLDMSAPAGTEWGPADTKFNVIPGKTVIPENASRSFKVEMEIPDRPECYGKKYHYILRVTPKGVGMSSGILFRMDIETIQK